MRTRRAENIADMHDEETIRLAYNGVAEGLIVGLGKES